MKTLPVIAFLIALGAFLFSSLSFETSASLLFTTGLLTILAADYTRRGSLVNRPRYAVAAADGPLEHRSDLRLAV